MQSGTLDDMRDERLERLQELARAAEQLAQTVERLITTERQERIGYTERRPTRLRLEDR